MYKMSVDGADGIKKGWFHSNALVVLPMAILTYALDLWPSSHHTICCLQ